ncbi:MAG: SDR family NAD(P)-dependent oxidoreductase [Ahrensia sp.]|nr:SDR family NAD(P)-dependent oxidoreductase [Ahrensia sp.]
MIDFQRDTFAITGGGSGIGLATAQRLLELNARVVLLDIALGGCQSLLAQHPKNALALTCDTSDPVDCKAAMTSAAHWCGGLSGLICSAGVYRDEPFAQMTLDQWRGTLSINLDGVYCAIHAALPHLCENASIVNLTSMAAHMGGSVSHVHYGASKGGVLALTRGLARELGPKIRVNAVSPGVIETPMTQSLLAERGDRAIEQTPLRRFGTASDVANTIAFLSSDQASFITGEVIHVNGGMYMD